MLFQRRKKERTPRALRRRWTIMVLLFFIGLGILTAVASRVTGEAQLERLPDAFYKKLFNGPVAK